MTAAATTAAAFSVSYHGASFSARLVEAASGFRLALYRNGALVAAGLSSSDDVAAAIWFAAPYVAGSSREELAAIIGQAMSV